MKRGCLFVALTFLILRACSAQTIEYSSSYLDSSQIVKIDSRIASSKHLDCLDEIRAGKGKTALAHARALISKKGDDLVAWYLAVQATLQAKIQPYPLLRELSNRETRADLAKKSSEGQRFGLILSHALRIAYLRSSGQPFDANGFRKYLASIHISQRGFSAAFSKPEPATDVVEAFLLADIWHQAGEDMSFRKQIRDSSAKFGDYRLNLMLARALDSGTGGYLNVPAALPKSKDAFVLVQSTYKAHPEDAVATSFYGTLLAVRHDNRAIAVLQKYLAMKDPYSERRKKAKARLDKLLIDQRESEGGREAVMAEIPFPVTRRANLGIV